MAKSPTPSPADAPSAPAERSRRTVWIAAASLAAIAAIATDIFLALHPLKGSWDDGSITAAFARTWAQTGRIALTPTSVQVEGYSSVLWFLLLSVPAFFSSRTELILVWMKVLSGVFAAASLALFCVVARAQFSQRRAIAAAVLFAAYSTAHLREIRNGMEMNLDAFLLLLLFWLLTKERQRARIALATSTACLLLLTRFEAPFQFAFLMLGMLYAATRDRAPVDAASLPGSAAEPLRVQPRGATTRQLLWIGALTTMFFFAIAAWRHHTFGLWMPNTVYAKQHAPYNSKQSFLGTRLGAFLEPLRVLLSPILAATVAVLWARSRKEIWWRSLGRVHPAIWTLAFGCFFFGLLFGANWGYPGRMVLPMLAFLTLVAVAVCATAVQERRASTGLLAGALLLHGLYWIRVAHEPTLGITTRAVEHVGTGADSIRVALHRENLLVMFADVGASTLCCERLTVVDAAFLADPTLSHTGFAGVPAYFRVVRPELVEVQSDWADKSGLYSQGLLEDYSIVAAHGIRFFLRNDLYAQLLGERAGPVLPVASVPACLPPDPADRAFSYYKKTCLALNDVAADNNYP